MNGNQEINKLACSEHEIISKGNKPLGGVVPWLCTKCGWNVYDKLVHDLRQEKLTARGHSEKEVLKKR